MKAVLISIQPKWIQKIFFGNKTVEIRKTKPKIDTPFRCFIYCTNGFSPPDSVVFQKGMRGYIVGEFVCYTISSVPEVSSRKPRTVKTLQLLGLANMTVQELEDYLGGKGGFGWHISGLKIYDQPKPLSDFRGPCGECDGCDTLSLNNRICLKTLKRAPQSWCYVDGGLIG